MKLAQLVRFESPECQLLTWTWSGPILNLPREISEAPQAPKGSPQVLQTDKAGQLRVPSPSHAPHLRSNRKTAPSLSSLPRAEKVVLCWGHLRSKHGRGKPFHPQAPSFLNNQALLSPWPVRRSSPGNCGRDRTLKKMQGKRLSAG